MKVVALSIMMGAVAVLEGCEATGGGAADTLHGADAGQDVGSLDAGPTPDAGGVTPDFSPPASRLSLELADWGLSFTGTIYGAPPASWHTEAGRDGQCRLLTYTPEFCDPICEYPEVCAAGKCVGQPPLADAGTLTLTGFGDAITIAPSFPGSYFWQTEALKPKDAGPTLTVTSAGGDVPAFTLSVAPVTAPVPSGDWSAQLAARKKSEDVTLAWAATPGARISLRMTTGIGTHGGISPTEIECEGPDVGSLRLPGAWLDALYAEGWSCGECGGNDLWRYRAAATEADPRVQLRVQARASFHHHPNLH